MEDVAAAISKRPRGWVDEINRLIKVEKAEKKAAATWKPTAKTQEVLQEIQESKLHGIWFYRRYRKTIDAMKRHGLIDFEIAQIYGDEHIRFKTIEAA